MINVCRKWWAIVSSLCCGIFYRIQYEQTLDPFGTYIVCPNHTSNLDISWACLILKNDFHFMGKADLLKNPVTRLFFRTLDIPVDRDSKISSFRAFKKAKDNLLGGRSLIIFPEGKIGDEYPPALHEFKNGPFRLAIELNIPIVPVSSINTWKMMWDDGSIYGSKPGICDIYVHSPIETKYLNVQDAEHLREKVYHIIKQKLNEHEG